MHVLVVGANGLLGSNMVDVAQNRGHEITGTYHTTRPAFDITLEQLDLQNSTRIRTLLDRYAPDVVLNCAAITDVDSCESQQRQAQSVNASAPEKMATWSEHNNKTIVHISTDYVFDGTARSPYLEDANPNPRQAYGKTKLAGERAVRKSDADALVPRLSFVYGIHRSTDSLTGFPAWVRERLSAGEQIPLFTDQQVTPSRAGQVAVTTFDLLDAEATGVVHVASRSCVTPYQFGRAVRSALGANQSLLKESSIDAVDRSAERPRYTCLDVEHVEQLLGRPQPSIEADIAAISEWLSTD